MKTAIAVFVLMASLSLIAGERTENGRPKPFYKVAHISQSVIGISCPGNGGDPTVITNVSGTLLVSCGTK